VAVVTNRLKACILAGVAFLPSNSKNLVWGSNKNLDHLIKMHGSADSTTDEQPIASMKAKHKKKKKL
jgi:hypothetical protein